ncbi:MAG TPA: hypothetical protein VN803_08345 [Gemmatimonadales bacterium]|nr:hypothetical protein [Gemmatimonadales bacterium]
MHPTNSVILLEFNELTPTLVHRFMSAGKLPNFKRFYQESGAYVTDAEESQENLEPWIQWVTVHTGLSFAEHGVFTLGDGHKLKDKSLWDLVSDAGRSVWVCGSMNARYDLPLNGSLLPDPWNTTTDPQPEQLLPYCRFVQRNVQEHTNDRVPLSAADYLSFLRFMVTHGMSPATVRAIVEQLLRERRGKSRWKRAVILDKLQWDVFRHTYQKMRPALATFFLNSTAHLQHMYWRNMEPGAFTVQPTAQEQEEFSDAILFGYQQMDVLLGRCMDMADERTTLVLCTALSQQPCLKYEDTGGKRFHRPRRFEDFLTFAGVTPPYTVVPVMSEQFHVIFDDEARAEAAAQNLQSLRVNGGAALDVKRDGTAIFGGCHIFTEVPRDAVLTNGTGRSAPFFDVFYQAEGVKSGMHSGDGFLWIRTPSRMHHVTPGKVPLRCVAPTVLTMLGVTPPASMKAPPLSLTRPSAKPVKSRRVASAAPTAPAAP